MRIARALLEWLAHLVLVAGILASIHALAFALATFGLAEETKFFGVVPLRWLIDGADLALLIGLAVIGARAAIRAYKS